MMASPLYQPASHVQPPGLRHDLDLSTEQLLGLLELAQQVKQSRRRYASALEGRYVSLMFEKPSLRTRMTFELAIKQLGGDCVTQIGMIGDREPLKDVARNLARWTDAIVARTFTQQTIDELSRWSGLPVINALSDLYHPCQALADMLTLKEHFGRLRGLKLAYVGDGNNVAHSLLLCCARLGISCSVAAPAGYEPQPADCDVGKGIRCCKRRSNRSWERSGQGTEICPCGLYGRMDQYGAGIGSASTERVVRRIPGK